MANNVKTSKCRFLFSIIVLLGLILSSSQTVGQNQRKINISGQVLEETAGTPLIGVNIIVKGTQTGTITDTEGNFSMQINAGDALVFSYVGYETFEQTFTTEGTYTIRLKETSKSLEEIVVIGYGSASRKEITGSIASVKPEAFNKGTFNDAMGLLQGKVAGLSVIKPNGADPQAGYQILLRGTNTLTSGQGPLIIIDGVAGADLKNLDFEDVQSIDILKDGSAAAIYGTRGTNGVILITTKKAKTGKTIMEYTGQFSGQVAARMVKNLTADQFKYAIETYAPDKSGSIYGAKTNWYKEITRPVPFSHRQTLAISGGTETFSHRTSFNIINNQGLLKKNDANKYLFKTNIHQSLLDGRLDIDYNIIMGLRHYRPANYNIFYQAFIQNPTQPVYDPVNTMYGGYSSLPGIEYYNPVAMLKEMKRIGKSNDNGQNIRASLNLIQGLTWSNFLAHEGSNWEETTYRTRYYPSRIGRNGEAEISDGSSNSIQYESTLNYNFSTGNHNFQTIAGYSYQKFENDNDYMINSGYDTDLYEVYNIGAGSALPEGKGEMGSYKESSKLISFFGRVMYNYKGKYLASVSLRREGSSKFGENHKWGSFPAVSLGWRIHNEPFLQNSSWLDELKLRVGYGITGNQDFENYQSLVLMGKAGKFFYNGNWINSYQPVSNPNKDLRWEKKQEFNAGADFSLFKNRFGGSVDFYYRTSTDLLYRYSVSVPPYLYNQLFSNLGSIRNIGVEITLNGVLVKTNDFKWNTILTFSTNSNKLTKFSNAEFTNKYIDVGWIGGAIPQNSQRIKEGMSLGTFWGPVWLGVDESGYDKFKNANPIGLVNPENYEAIGNAYPICSLGWSNSMSYKNWDLSFSFRSNIGGNVLNLYRLYYENWQNIGTRNIVLSQLENPSFIGNATYSSKYVEDATFLKLDNVSIGYILPFRIKYIAATRFMLTAQDVFCLTGYQGVDPEVNLLGLEPGLERLTYYPRTTTITVGINLTF